jgi:hypothetical protein
LKLRLYRETNTVLKKLLILINIDKCNTIWFLLHTSFYHGESVCFKSVIQSGRSLFLSKIKNTSLTLSVGVSPLQLVKCLSSRNMIDKTMWSFMTKYLRFLCKFTSWSRETPTGNFSDVFFFILDKKARYSRNFNS